MTNCSLWQSDNDHDRLPDLTEDLVKMAEEKLGVQLPIAYLQLLKEQNGGYLHLNAHPSPVPNSWAEDHVNVGLLFGIGEDEGIMQTPYLKQE